MAYRIAAGLFLAIVFAPHIRSAEPTSRLAVDWPRERWQLLPNKINDVRVGPDGRTWYRLTSDAAVQATPQLRRKLEAEFREPSPQIATAVVALLEPGGRAWFFVNAGKELWGYDGQDWIEHKAAALTQFGGGCPTRGELLHNRHNRFAGGTAWFADQRGIHVFDGKEWSYEQLCDLEFGMPTGLRYAVSPSGTHAAAIVRQPEAVKSELWIWQNGKWSNRGRPWGDGPGEVGPFCITDEGVFWYRWSAGQLRSLRLAEPQGDSVLAQRQAWIAQLDDKKFAIREQATENLANEGAEVRPLLEAALKTSKSPEARSRLQALLKHLAGSGQAPPDPRSKEVTVGDCRVRNVASLFQDETGRLYVFAESVKQDGKQPISGLAIIGADGKAQTYPLVDGYAGSIRGTTNDHGPVLTAKGDALWLADSTFGPPLRRLDLATKQVSVTIPDAAFRFVHAVDDAGQAFVGRGVSSIYGGGGLGMALFIPDQPDQRLALKSHAETIAHYEYLIAADGAVWANRPGAGLSRYDGKAWHLLRDEDQGECHPLVAGLQNVVLVRTEGGYILFQDGKKVAEDSLKTLIADHVKTFADAFPPSFTPPPHFCTSRQERVWIATDKQQNIWLVEDKQLSVRFGDRWIDVVEPLQKQGWEAPATRLLSSAGDGASVFLSDDDVMRGPSLLATLQGGKGTVTKGPRESTDSRVLQIRDGEGGLWIEGNVDNGPFAGASGYRVFRLDPPRGTQELINEGLPRLVDRSGNVWLARDYSTAHIIRFAICRKGQVEQRLEIPGTHVLYGLFSDQANSVYAWTALGLHRLVGRDGKDYQLDKTFAMPTLPDRTNSAYSDLLGLVVNDPGAEYRLHFVQLPDK
jgi:hypothetical protein